jgi:hypothetical protein
VVVAVVVVVGWVVEVVVDVASTVVAVGGMAEVLVVPIASPPPAQPVTAANNTTIATVIDPDTSTPQGGRLSLSDHDESAMSTDHQPMLPASAPSEHIAGYAWVGEA